MTTTQRAAAAAGIARRVEVNRMRHITRDQLQRLLDDGAVTLVEALPQPQYEAEQAGQHHRLPLRQPHRLHYPQCPIPFADLTDQKDTR